MVRFGHANLRVRPGALFLRQHERDDAREIGLERQNLQVHHQSQVVFKHRRRAQRRLAELDPERSDLDVIDPDTMRPVLGGVTFDFPVPDSSIGIFAGPNSPTHRLNSNPGSPASDSSRANISGAVGSRSEGFKTKVFPQARATGNIHIGTMHGKLKGVMPATTPSGEYSL